MDHTPCIVRNVNLDGRRANSFKYFNMWSDAPNFLDTVKSYWNQQIDGTKMFRVVKKLKALKGGLKSLNKECFSDVELNASKASHYLEDIQLQIQDNYDNPDLIALELQAMDNVRFWTKARDSFLQQKAKSQWIDEGDSNTAYFHNVIKKRCLRNKIVQIEDRQEKETEYVRMEVLQMVPFAVIGIDSWDIVGDEVCGAIMEFFTTGLLTQINATNVTLIPKFDRPTVLLAILDLYCCNLLYKMAIPVPSFMQEHEAHTPHVSMTYFSFARVNHIVHLVAHESFLFLFKGFGLAMNNSKSEIFFNGVRGY
ncbi:uncharacterized protein LOC141613945 [Silene latifolia]|uniref:uncharacterized protein LOC141613945 n=1 Tax=Silene latifolia TaxID=37657 RepID=UPI003D7740EB